ncbi:MAG: hypothetical protein Q8L82_02325 [Nitrosomonas sp.]|nr:hypothetical protein [Nitrosomonas sp.]
MKNENDEERIIISRVSEYRKTDSPENEPIPVTSVNRWIVYLTLIPVVIVMAVLGAFFFAAFLAIFAIAAVVFALRLWWLRRKFRDRMHTTEEGDFVVIEDAEIIETEVEPEERKTSKRKK